MVKKWKSEKVGAVVLLLFSVLLACCQRQAINGVVANTVSLPVVSTRQVTDDLGRTVTIPVKVTRIVSTAPSVTEMIFATGGADRLVGVTTFCNYPEEAKSIAKIGDTMNPNMESIVALKPDIVFVSTASQIEAFTKTLEQNGIAVYVLNPTSLYGLTQELEQLGNIFGTTDTSNKLIAQINGRERLLASKLGTDLQKGESPQSYDKRVGSVRVFVQISREPLFTIGQSAFLTRLLVSAGGRSVTENVESAYPKLSKETALALQPEVIILSASDDNREPNEVFKNSPAVKNGRVYSIDADILSRPGPRLVDALEQIARLLHPEKFK